MRISSGVVVMGFRWRIARFCFTVLPTCFFKVVFALGLEVLSVGWLLGFVFVPEPLCCRGD